MINFILLPVLALASIFDLWTTSHCVRQYENEGNPLFRFLWRKWGFWKASLTILPVQFAVLVYFSLMLDEVSLILLFGTGVLIHVVAGCINFKTFKVLREMGIKEGPFFGEVLEQA